MPVLHTCLVFGGLAKSPVFHPLIELSNESA